jgi:aminopeptidase N
MITKRTRSFLIPIFLVFAADLTSRAESEFERLECMKSATFLAPADSSDHRQYAPDRKISIRHLLLDVTPDFIQRTITGKATFSFKPIAMPLDVLELDAVDLSVSAVAASVAIRGHQVTGKKLTITFEPPVPPDQEVTLTTTYTAEPTRGLYFRTPEMGYRPGDTHLFTQGEAIEARHWYPCYDAPNAKFTSEVICHVPEGMTVLSNGKLVSQQKDAQTGLVTVRWLQDKPHVNYLISLVAGHFKKIEDQYNDIPLAFFTPASDIGEAANSFRDTKDMMGFFEREIGVPYPWAKYYQVCVNDFVAGGMENTSITTLTDGTLFTTATENIRTSQGLVAHELAHQWFGDLVTCKDWSHLWLNEGFATFYAHLYDGYKNGRDSLLYGLFQDARGFLDTPNDTKPIVFRGYNSPDEQFSFLAYPKGSWVLRMLQSQLGESLYRRCIKTYLERHQYENVITEDLNAVIEELSGRSFDQFFDQWVYHAHHPELDVNYTWSDKEKLAKLSIKQIQKLSPEVLLFRFPLKVRFKAHTATVDREIWVKEKEEDFYFPLDAPPEIVRLDPDYALLAKITFNLPTPMLHAQLADQQDSIGRLFAIEQLSKKKDRETVEKLKQTLNNDPFYGVRIEAVKALRGIHSTQAFEALLASKAQVDARVRREVVSALSGFYSEAALEGIRQVLAAERNPDILTPAIQALGAYGRPEVRDLLLPYLDSESYRNSLLNAAFGAIRSQGDPAFIQPLKMSLQRRGADLTRQGITRGLGALAYIARNEKEKTEIRELLLSYVNHPRQAVQLAAIRALGTLEDSRAIAALEKFSTAAKDTPKRKAAEEALTALRAARKPTDDLKDLRNEVLELQKRDRDQQKQLEELRKKIESIQPPPMPSSAKRKNPLSTKLGHR